MSRASMRCGRYVISGPGDLPVRHFLRSQLTVHGRRERLLRSVLLRLPEGTAGALLPWVRRPVPRRRSRAEERVARAAIGYFRERGALREEGVSADRVSWILRVDAVTTERRRVVVLLFDDGRSWPRATLKLGPKGDAEMDREWPVLSDLQRRLGPSLAGTVPRPVARARIERREAVLLSALPGRAADVELQAAWCPDRVVRGHLRAAADWLVAFQRRTRSRTPFETAAWSAELGSDAKRAEAELEGCIGARRPALVAAHGDLWVRNLLVACGGEPAAVIDWESSRPASAPFEDPLHFAVAYARRYHRDSSSEAADAFRAAFVADTRIARHLAAFLHRWSRGVGVDPRCLEPALRLFVGRRAAGIAGPHRQTEEERRFWVHSERILTATTRSALSG